MINTRHLQDDFEIALKEASDRSRARLDEALARRQNLTEALESSEDETIRVLLDREGPGSLMDDIRNARDLDENETERFAREHIRLRDR